LQTADIQSEKVLQSLLVTLIPSWLFGFLVSWKGPEEKEAKVASRAFPGGWRDEKVAGGCDGWLSKNKTVLASVAGIGR
jgi:hypothetical protein